jgi:hypothetical protein
MSRSIALRRGDAEARIRFCMFIVTALSAMLITCESVSLYDLEIAYHISVRYAHAVYVEKGIDV